jgi:hypothetical protein
MAMTIKKDRAAAAPTSHADASSSDVSRSFETLFLEHWSHVYGLLLRLVGDQAEAEDLALYRLQYIYNSSSAGLSL